MTTPPRTCVFCRASTAVNDANGVIIKYKSHRKKNIEVPLHKSCAAAWSKQFTKSIPLQIATVD